MSLFRELAPWANRQATARKDGAEEERFVAPYFELKESDEAFGLEVFIPGVAKDAVEIAVDQGELVVTARRRWNKPEGWTELFRESAEVDYRLRMGLNEAVDVEKINAEHENGVLRVTLPKAEAVKPRRIQIG